VEIVVLVPHEHPAVAQMPLDSPDGVLEHGADFAGSQMPEPDEEELVLLLVPGTVQEHGVDVWIDGTPSPTAQPRRLRRPFACGSGLRSSLRSEETRCRTVTQPVFAPSWPSSRARSA
jgi:hypothetical protein